jgi:CubicO group peptidase (beta-lactamase class C family)
MPIAATFAQLAGAAGYRRDDPLVIAVTRRGRPASLARGCVPLGAVSGAQIVAVAGVLSPGPDGPAHGPSSFPEGNSADSCGPGRQRMTAGTLVYVASLAKQVTAACAALLVRDGALGLDAPVADLVPGLPPWSTAVRIRHLIHHTSGLPADGAESAPDRTNDGVLGAGNALEATPGTRFGYSNVGYVCLAAAVERVAGEPIAGYARRRIFEPLGMADTVFWDGPAPAPPGGAPLDPVRPAPLSLGDGGIWSTAEDLLRWCAGLDDDRLGITGLVQTPGRLDDGTELDYAWGMGVRRHGALTVYRHGGAYADVRTMLMRVPERDLDLAILSLADRSERRTVLADALLDNLLA